MRQIPMERCFKFLILLCGLAMSGVLSAQVAGRPVRIIAGSAAGGIADLLARPIAEAMSKSLGAPVIVDDRPGAAGLVAVNELLRSPADGNTILQLSATVSVLNQFLFSKLPYDPEKDIVPVSITAGVPMLMVVNPSVQARTIEEFVAAAKAAPGKLTYGHGGLGAPAHMAFERLRGVAGIDVVPVAYKSGPFAVQDLLGGRIDAMIEGISLVENHIKDGRLRLLAVTDSKRHPAFPDVPTATERAYPGYVTDIWIGMGVRSGTPPAAVTRLNAEINAAMSSALVKETYAKLRFDVRPSLAPKEFADFIAAERKIWGPVIRNANVKLD